MFWKIHIYAKQIILSDEILSIIFESFNTSAFTVNNNTVIMQELKRIV